MNQPLSPATLDNPELLAQVLYYRTSVAPDGNMSAVEVWDNLAKESQEKYLSLATDIADQRRRFTPAPPADVPDALLSRGDMLSWVTDELAIGNEVAKAFVAKLYPMVRPYVDAHGTAQQIRRRWEALGALQYSLGLEAENMETVAGYLREISATAADMLVAAAATSTAVSRRMREAMTMETT